jgi:prepilin peptidase CpaA
MNLLATAPYWALAVLVVALLAAAIEDAARLRISNLTCLVVLAAAIAAAVAAGPSSSIWQNVAVFAMILALGTGAFAAGMLGGGDVKLLAAVGLWVDLRTAVWLVGLVFISGGLVALAYLMSRPFRRSRSKDRRVPYGIAIAVGAIAVIGFAHAPSGDHQRSFPALKFKASQK